MLFISIKSRIMNVIKYLENMHLLHFTGEWKKEIHLIYF